MCVLWQSFTKRSQQFESIHKLNKCWKRHVDAVDNICVGLSVLLGELWQDRSIRPCETLQRALPGIACSFPILCLLCWARNAEESWLLGTGGDVVQAQQKGSRNRSGTYNRQTTDGSETTNYRQVKTQGEKNRSQI